MRDPRCRLPPTHVKVHLRPGRACALPGRRPVRVAARSWAACWLVYEQVADLQCSSQMWFPVQRRSRTVFLRGLGSRW